MATLQRFIKTALNERTYAQSLQNSEVPNFPDGLAGTTDIDHTPPSVTNHNSAGFPNPGITYLESASSSSNETTPLASAGW